MPEQQISHAFVLPDRDFIQWFNVLRPYLKAFERVAVVRSPAGNDLNRYRTVTAVQAPLTWFQDDALNHIRRIYPSVVTVDLIHAETPEQLEPLLTRRINRKDRYGERDTTPQHIFTRFVLEWATDHRPMALRSIYNDKPAGGELNERMEIITEKNGDVLCAASGTVIAIRGSNNEFGLRSFIQIETFIDDQKYITTYEGTHEYQVKLRDKVELGQVIAKCRYRRLGIIVQNPTGDEGVDIFTLKDIVNPRDFVYIQNLRVRPISDGLRVRSLPSLDGNIVGKIYTWDLVEPLEHHGRAIEKMGVQDKWIKVRLLDGTEGYTAAWYVEATTKADGSEVFVGVNPVGVNLDVHHAKGLPNPTKLGDIGWVRFGYNVSNGVGSEDINATLQRYLPIMQKYRQAGYRIIFTTSHQTYGEGKHEFWPWPDMNDQKWGVLTDRFADMMNKIARQWAGRDLISAWQVWNEQDAPIGATSSVPMHSHNYTRMFARVYQAIRTEDKDVQILTGGFTGGPDKGAIYARQVVENLPSNAKPDGIAFHPYGRGNGHPIYSRFGHIDDSIQAYSSVMSNNPLWITEWGVLDRPNDDPKEITKYALTFIQYLKQRYPGKIATMIWYAWAEGMHNGYGIVDKNGNPRPPLTNSFLSS